MKLRLALLVEGLAQRFSISKGLVSKLFHCWIRAVAECLKHIVYIPEQGVINVTKPNRFKSFKGLTAIIDYSEIFIETPKDLELQSAT